jgi:hypothetical protein
MGKFLSFLIIILLWPKLVLASDISPSVASGELFISPNKEIILEKEKLFISQDQIKTEYYFNNISEKDIESYVSFELPSVPFQTHEGKYLEPQWDELYNSYQIINSSKIAEISSNSKFFGRYYSFNQKESSAKKAPFINYQLNVNNEKVDYNIHFKAVDKKGKDITRILIDNNIPLSAAYIMGFKNGHPMNDANLKYKLMRLSLLDKNEMPNWKLQTIYFSWQNFKAGQVTKITHQYRPSVGSFNLASPLTSKVENISQINFVHNDNVGKKWQDYCLKDKEVKNIISSFNKFNEDKHNHIFSAQEINYLLTSPTRVLRSIGEFSLEIDVPRGKEAFLCFDGEIQRLGNKIFVMKDKFIPSRDLKILFIPSNKVNVTL